MSIQLNIHINYTFFRLFEEAALKLNLRSLTNFFSALCTASHSQLFSQHALSTPEGTRKWWAPARLTKAWTLLDSDASLLLVRVGQVMLKTVRSGRPLIHVMRVWSIVGPHLMEVFIHTNLAYFII